MDRYGEGRSPSKSGIGFGVGFLVVAVVGFGLISWVFSVTPGPGREAVLTDYPVFWGHGGVRLEPVKTGRKFVWPTTGSATVDMRPQQFDEHFDDLMSSDGVPLDFDAIARLQIVNSVMLIEKFGEDWYKNNVAAEFRNRVRQAVRKHGMNETAIETKAIDDIDHEISDSMEKYLKSSGLPVILVQVTVGKANPPDAVKSQRIKTAEQQQRQLTEKETKLAEDQRKSAEESRADADNGYRNKMGLTSEQFLVNENIKMQREVCKDGHCTFVVSGANSGVLVAPALGMSAKENTEQK